MPDNIKFRFPPSEQEKFKKWTRSLQSETVDELRTIIAQTLNDITRYAKVAAPYKHSYLRSSIRMNIRHDGLGGLVGSNKEYAPYMEFGTGKWVLKNYSQYNRILPGLEEYASGFKGKGIRKVNIYPRAYLFPAYALSVKNMMMKLNKMGFKNK